MKVIIATPAIPRPFGDTAAKSYFALIKELLAANSQVACFTVTEESKQAVSDAQDFLFSLRGADNLKLSWFDPKPTCGVLARKARSIYRPFSETFHATGLRAAIKSEMMDGYDVFHLEQLWTGWLGFGVPRTLLNIHHFEIIDWEEKADLTSRERKALFQMTRATSRILKGNRDIRVFTERLRLKAQSINPKANYNVIPFALTLSFYPMQPIVEEPIIGLIGSMHWLPSRSAAERLITRIWPLIKTALPKARLLIGGWNARRHLKNYLDRADILIEENINHPSEFFSKIAVMVYAPSRGSGMKIKVMESMAYGVPVVTNTEGAEGIDYVNGVHCHVSDEDEVIAVNAITLAENVSARSAMRESARTLLENRYSDAVVFKRIFKIYTELQGGGDA